jgi:hypothetical protein
MSDEQRIAAQEAAMRQRQAAQEADQQAQTREQESEDRRETYLLESLKAQQAAREADQYQYQRREDRAETNYLESLKARQAVQEADQQEQQQPTAGSTTPIAVGPHTRDPNQDVFRMVLDEWHDHPGVQGFTVNVALYETTLRMQVRPYHGSDPLLFAFDDFPKNTWVTVQDDQGNSLPLAVYVDGAIGVYGKWLYPQHPPA